MTERIFEMQHIDKLYGSLLANDDVSIHLNRGEILCLVGENGAGKSTIMKILYGLEQPSGGTIRAAEGFPWETALRPSRSGPARPPSDKPQRVFLVYCISALPPFRSVSARSFAARMAVGRGRARISSRVTKRPSRQSGLSAR